MGDRRRLADVAAEAVGEGSADRDRALGAHPVPRLLAAGASRRFRRSRHGNGRTLRQLQRRPADQPQDPPAGHILLGVLHLCARRHGLPDHGAAATNRSWPHQRLSAVATRALSIGYHCCGDRRPVRLCIPYRYLPRWLVSPIRRHDPSPPWQWPFVLAFTGVRGIVSLAAAFAIPFATATGAPFPDRDLILFLTFSVILVTLVGQGLLLPWVIRRLGLAHAGRREREFNRAEELKARAEAVQAASERLDQLAEERNLPVEVIEVVRAQHRDRLQHIEDRSADEGVIGKHSDLHEEVERLLIDAERTRINDLFRTGKLKDEARRRIERELDLREAELPK